MKKKCISALLIVVAGFVSALQYNLFVFPNDFAPAGLNGICTIIQHVFGFAFGWQFIPVILCVLYSFVTSRVNDSILKGARSAAKFEVVTGSPEELSAKLMRELRHGCTVVPAKGMYSNTDKSLLICIVNRMQIADFEKIIKGFPDCFVIILMDLWKNTTKL